MNSRLAGALVWRDFRIELSYRVPWMLDAIGLVSVLAIYFYIVRFTRALAPGANNFFTYIVPGLALIRFQLGLGRTLASMDREQSSGTLELLISSPVRAWAVVAAASLYELSRSLVMALIALALGRWLFGAGLTLGPRSWPALGFGLVGAAAFYLALTGVTCAVLIAFKQGLPVAGVLGAVLPVISGIYFSPHVLPAFLHSLTNIFPLSLAVQVVRAGVVAGSFPVGKTVVMLATSFACLPLSAIAIHAAVARARRLGTLGQY
ncbi:MAG: ABC transporter permease [Actinobacteria bacterium]|nr:MAG: ABC transporter permease [Actinomycetota bacterium]